MASGSDRNPIIIGGLPSQVPDFDPEETQEWLDSLDAAIDERGRERARYLMLRLIERAREKRVAVPEMRSTDYVNTIPTRPSRSSRATRRSSAGSSTRPAGTRP